MSDLLDKPIVLSLNRAWQVIGHRTVKQALVALNGGSGDITAALGLDITYAQRADATWDFDRAIGLQPLAWAEWIKLPVREFDFAINTPNLRLRVPTVIICPNFDQMPVRTPRLSRQAIFERDGGICQYTGKFVGKHGGNLDHVIPRHRGGRDTFENLVWAKREINSYKANRLPHEAGLKLIRRPRAPAPLPFSETLQTNRHPDWKHFITR